MIYFYLVKLIIYCVTSFIFLYSYYYLFISIIIYYLYFSYLT